MSLTVELERLPLGLQILRFPLTPVQSLPDDEVHHGPILLLDLRRVLVIPAQVGRHALETVDLVRSCRNPAVSASCLFQS